MSWALCLGVGNKEMLGSSGFGSRWQYLVCQRGSVSENFQNGQNILDFAHGINNLIQAWSSGCSLWKFIVGNRQNMEKSLFLVKSVLILHCWKQIAFVTLRKVKHSIDLIWNSLLHIQIKLSVL